MNQPTQSPKVQCPQCQAVLSVPNSALGSTITCSDCLEDFVATALGGHTPEPQSGRSTAPVTPPEDAAALSRVLNPPAGEASDDLGAIRLDDDAEDEGYVRKKVKVLKRDYEFSQSCMPCGSRIDLNDSQIGKKVKCHDCHSPIEVREPSPENRRAPFHAEPALHDDDDFNFADGDDTPAVASPYHSIANDLMASAETEVAASNASAPTPAAPQVPPNPTLDALKRAEESADEIAEQDRPPLPPSPFTTRVFKFLIDPLTIARLLVLAFALFIELAAVQAAVVEAEGGPIAQFLSVIARMVAVVVGLIFALNLSVSLLGILSDTANGQDNIESWPDVNFLDWMGEALYVFSALFLAVLPGCAFAQALYMVGLPSAVFWVFAIVGSGIGITCLFPFVLVSMLEAGSPIMPFSQPINQSLRLARGSWIVFTMIAGCVVTAGAGLCAVRLFVPNYLILNLIVAVLLTVVMAVYFRLVGRLTWCCDEAVLAEHIRLEEAAELQE